MDKTKHALIKYCQGEKPTKMLINNIRNVTQLEDDIFEIEMAKNVNNIDLPIQAGFFILQYAKQRMLEFYYDFLSVYVDRSDFELSETDTDSLYMMISGECLDDVIKPCMKESYIATLKKQCRDDFHYQTNSLANFLPRTCCKVCVFLLFIDSFIDSFIFFTLIFFFFHNLLFNRNTKNTTVRRQVCSN